MKDVDGVQSADPKLIPTARVIPRLSYDEALQMMGCGAKILQAPAVEMAADVRLERDRTLLHVRAAVNQDSLGHRH